ncbi:MAG: proprotein convertase P-domain-containing protein, partial [Dolichospermum sp.]
MISTNVQKWGGVVASLVSILALSSAAEAITFISPTGPYNIPNNNATGVTASINISGQPNNIASFNSVTISGFNHTYYADLRAFLSNGATTVQLFATQWSADDVGFELPGGDLNGGNYTFATVGANWYEQTNPVPPATYASFQALDAFDGSQLNGTWTLNVQDRAGGAAGSFSSFSIDVTPVPFESNAAPAAMAIVFGAFFVRRKLQQRSTQKMLAESVDSGLIHEP